MNSVQGLVSLADPSDAINEQAMYARALKTARLQNLRISDDSTLIKELQAAQRMVDRLVEEQKETKSGYQTLKQRLASASGSDLVAADLQSAKNQIVVLENQIKQIQKHNNALVKESESISQIINFIHDIYLFSSHRGNASGTNSQKPFTDH